MITQTETDGPLTSSCPSDLQHLHEAVTAPPIAQDPELIADFVNEAREHLSTIEERLLTLEQDTRNVEIIHSIFRSYHTIKGIAGFLELTVVREIAHEIETVLDRARESQLTVTPAVVDVILAGKDFLLGWVEHLDKAPSEPVPARLVNTAPILRQVRAALSQDECPQPADSQPVNSQAVNSQPMNSQPMDSQPAPAEAAEATQTSAPQERGPAARSVKVDVAKLDTLVDMVGELVIAQSLIRHDPVVSLQAGPELGKNLSQLARITEEIQRTALGMRMVPVGPLFQKMARLVRDLSRRLEKSVRFETVGEEVELDRTMVDDLADPLMHMVRNALDHGIEPSGVRLSSGKPATASVSLRASHRAGQIVIELADDGRGLDAAKLQRKAQTLGLIAPDAVLTETESFNLICHPGFSTAEKVSDVSGRGVGMDVVRRQIQKLRGDLDIQSQLGKGTTFTLKLPLTLAIIDGLIVQGGPERFIVPLAAVREVLRAQPGMIRTIEQRNEVALIRNAILPVVRLSKRFGHAQPDPNPGVLVTVEAEGRRFCLVVDAVHGKQEIVIKPLGDLFRDVPGVAGGAILGDGRVGLILDLPKVAA